MFNIIRVLPGDANFHLFKDFKKEIYPEDSLVFKMPEAFNEYLEGCYLLIADNKVKCRAALYKNPHLSYDGKKACCVGNFESVNDKELSTALLSHIALQAKTLGAGYIIGPMNGSTWDNYRFSTHHDHPHFFLEPYHHLYYNHLFDDAGFEVISRYYSGVETDLKINSPAVLKREEELQQAGVTFRNIDLGNYESELGRVFNFNHTAFKSNLLYTPISRDDFMGKYTQTKRLIDPQFVILAEDADKNLIGFFFCIDDLYNCEQKTLIAKTVARHPDKKWGGVGHVLGNIICRRALAGGYHAVIHAFMYDEGTSITMSKNFSGNAYKNYVLLGKMV